MYFSGFVGNVLIILFDRVIFHKGTGRFAEHILHGEIYRFYSVFLFKDKTHVSGSFSYDIHRCTFTVCDLSNMIDVFFTDKHSHAFLTFVSDNFFCRKSRVTYRQFVHLDFTTCRFYQFRQGIQMSSGSMVMNRNDGVIVRFGKCTNDIRYTFLHFRISALYSV